MAETTVLSAEVRQQVGTLASRRYRRGGNVPGVLYGHKEDPVAIVVSEEALRGVVRHGAHALLELQIGGQKQSAIIKEMQWDVFGREILHVDFARVSKGDRITMTVPVLLRGTAPGLSEGGVLDHQLHSIEIQCPADRILENVVVNVNQLHLNNAILVRDLGLPEGVTALVVPEQIVVQAVPPREEKEPELGETAGVEPELIRRESKKDEGAE